MHVTINRMIDHAELDLPGLVRREDHEGGYTVWVRQPDGGMVGRWQTFWSTSSERAGRNWPTQMVQDWPIIGVIPFSPAAEQLHQCRHCDGWFALNPDGLWVTHRPAREWGSACGTIDV